MIRTRDVAALEDGEALHENDPERAEMIARARRFKTSWIELAEALSEVRRSGRFKDWGHDSFEDYAKKELKLRQETVDKLTGSYAFLKKRAPEVLRRDGLEEAIPTYQAIDYLRRAEDREDAPSEAVKELREKVLDQITPVAQLKRDFGPRIFPPTTDERREKELIQLKAAATRLRDVLAEATVVPSRIAVETRQAVERLIEALADKETKAA